MITHANIVAAIGGAKLVFGSLITEHEVYLGYLPLAHILEFTVEHFIIYSGGRIGYGSPRTLVDASVRNCKGDLTELRPTLMAGVPAGMQS
jgi:long-chain acyl-CoA synthetase